MPSYHEGEIEVQERSGVRDAAARLESGISDSVPERARTFVRSVEAVATCARTPDNRLWASLWLGEPGLLTLSAGGDVVSVRPDAGARHDDPVHAACSLGGDIGMLAIDLATRRRLRMNGQIISLDGDIVVVRVRESFVNCPKYIQRRVPVEPDHQADALPAVRGGALDDARTAVVRRADTAFIATMHPRRGLDVSHRGGEPGFMRVLDERTLWFPDYRGNNMFTSLGNLAVSPRASLAITDFESRRILSMTGEARVVEASADTTTGVETGRACVFSVESWIEFPMHGVASWSLLDRSPFNPPVIDVTSGNGS